MNTPLELTVGPVLYHWPRQVLLDFYADMADSPATTVVLGEVVCARRRELRLADWLAVGRELAAAGKRVVLATQALVETEADLRLIAHQGEQGEFAVEAGDASALALLAGKVPLVLGPHINVYSRAALQEHADLGVRAWVAPVELSLDAVAHINPAADPVCTPEGQAIRTEVWAFGRVPLSFSARCFTARHHHVAKDQCGYPCIADGDGLAVRSTDGTPFLVLNGNQTQSAAVQCLLGDGAALRAAGVHSLRLSPCAQGFGQVLRDHDDVINRGAAAAPALQAWPALGVPSPLGNGYAHRQPGMNWNPS